MTEEETNILLVSAALLVGIWLVNELSITVSNAVESIESLAKAPIEAVEDIWNDITSFFNDNTEGEEWQGEPTF